MREMKDSGIEWIGEIPKDWKVSRIKYVAGFFNGDRGKNYPSGDDMVEEGIIFLTSNNIHGIEIDISPQKSKYITKERYDLLGGAKIRYNDILYCLRGSVGLCSINTQVNEGTIASSLVNIRPFKIVPGFLNYLLHSRINIYQTLIYTNGSCAANLSAENVANFYLLEPPINDQRIISNFLDTKCAEIDALTQDIQNQIDTLQQYKQSVITEAVTKGLDPDVEMKDSGFEWIGKIPKGWRVSRIKYIAAFFNGDRGKNYPSGDDMVDDGIIFLTSNNIHGINLDISPQNSKYITEERYNLLGGAKIRYNDIIYCLRGSVGLCSINTQVNEGTIASSLVDIRPINISPVFLNYFLHSPINSHQTLMFTNGSCAANLSADNVANFYLLEPPINEQKKIGTSLDIKCAEIDDIITEKNKQLDILADYKKSLIFEYVTGKKEVPSA